MMNDDRVTAWGCFVYTLTPHSNSNQIIQGEIIKSLLCYWKELEQNRINRLTKIYISLIHSYSHAVVWHLLSIFVRINLFKLTKV